MTIYGSGYRPLSYRATGVLRRWWAVAALEYGTLFRRRAGIALFVACLAPSVVNLGILLVQTGIWQVGVDPERTRAVSPRMNPESIDFWLTPLIGEIFGYVIFLVVTSLVSCRAIAKDRESNALELYWTRGIEPRGYFLAKWLGSFLLIGTMLVAAPLVVWSLGVVLAPDWGFLRTTWAFMPRVVLALLLFTAVLTWLAVAFSAAAGTPGFASILWFFLLVGTSALGRLLARIVEGEWWFKAINPWDAMKRVAEWISGYTPREDYPPEIAALAVAVVLLAVTSVGLSRMRRVEASAG